MRIVKGRGDNRKTMEFPTGSIIRNDDTGAGKQFIANLVDMLGVK